MEVKDKLLRYPISDKGEVSFSEFSRLVWRMSKKVIHYDDYKRIYNSQLKELYNKTI